MIEGNLKKIFIESTKNIRAGYSYVLRCLIEDYIDKKKTKVDLRLSKDIKNYLNEKKFEKKKKEHKKRLFCYYIINNTLKTIYKLSTSHLINSGKLNMNIISKVIDSAEEIYNTYSEDIKNDLKIEFDNLKLLKNEEYLMDKMRILKLIQFKK